MSPQESSISLSYWFLSYNSGAFLAFFSHRLYFSHSWLALSTTENGLENAVEICHARRNLLLREFHDTRPFGLSPEELS